MTNYLITTSRAELAKALALVTIGVRKGTTFEIRFSLKDGLLDIMGPGAAHSLPAQGLWPSAVLADARVLRGIASRLPSADPALLRAENSRLYIGGFSVEATVLDIAPIATQLAIGSNGADILIAVERMGQARVAGSVGMRAIEGANEELLKRVDKALQALEPYNLARDEVISLVRRTLRQKALSLGVSTE
jgi:hypothetical protein